MKIVTIIGARPQYFIAIANPMDKLITVSKKAQQIGICGRAAVKNDMIGKSKLNLC